MNLWPTLVKLFRLEKKNWFEPGWTGLDRVIGNSRIYILLNLKEPTYWSIIKPLSVKRLKYFNPRAIKFKYSDLIVESIWYHNRLNRIDQFGDSSLALWISVGHHRAQYDIALGMICAQHDTASRGDSSFLNGTEWRWIH